MSCIAPANNLTPDTRWHERKKTWSILIQLASRWSQAMVIHGTRKATFCHGETAFLYVTFCHFLYVPLQSFAFLTSSAVLERRQPHVHLASFAAHTKRLGFSLRTPDRLIMLRFDDVRFRLFFCFHQFLSCFIVPLPLWHSMF